MKTILLILLVASVSYAGGMNSSTRDGAVTAIPNTFVSADSVVISGLKYKKHIAIQHNCAERIEFCWKDACVDDEDGNWWLPASTSNFGFDNLNGGNQIRARSMGAALTTCQIIAGGW